MSKLSRTIAWALIVAFVLIRWLAVESYNPMIGFDGPAHIDYLEWVFQGIMPRANQLWQGYQAPAYYVISAKLAHLVNLPLVKVAQAVTAMCSILLGVPGFLLARRLVPGWEPLVVLSLLMFPASLSTSPMIYSQQLATLMGGCFLVLLMRAWDSNQWKPSRELGLGVFWAAAIISRFDGFFLGFGLALLWLKRLRQDWRRGSLALIFTGAVTLALISPILLANIAEFDQPMVRNRDARAFPYALTSDEILPNFLNPVCLVNPGFALWINPRAKNVESIPVSLFVRFWLADHKLAPPWVMILAGLFLSSYIVRGLRSTWRKKSWWPLYSVACGNIILMLSFLAREPDLSGYKAVYFHGTYYLLALALAKGAKTACASWKQGEPWLLATCLGPIAVLAVANLLEWWRINSA